MKRNDPVQMNVTVIVAIVTFICIVGPCCLFGIMSR